MDRVDYLVCPAKTEEERFEWEKKTLAEMNQETTDIKLVDYSINKQGTLPVSYAMCKTEADYVQWYNHFHPELPDDVIAIAARCTANPTLIPQPKQPEEKKIEAKPEFAVKRGDVTVDFS